MEEMGRKRGIGEEQKRRGWEKIEDWEEERRRWEGREEYSIRYNSNKNNINTSTKQKPNQILITTSHLNHPLR